MTDSKLFHLMNLALAAVVTAVLWFDPGTAIQLMALTGATWLAMLLIVPRLLYGKPFAKWQPQLERVAKMSKYVGLWVAGWFAAHAITASATYAPRLEDKVGFLTSKPIILAVLSISVLLVLAVISNKWSYAHIKWWKQINMLIWAIPFMAIAHSLMAAATYRGEAPLLWIAPALLTAAGLIGFDSLFKKDRRYTDKLRMTYLAVSAVVTSLVVLLWPR